MGLPIKYSQNESKCIVSDRGYPIKNLMPKERCKWHLDLSAGRGDTCQLVNTVNTRNVSLNPPLNHHPQNDLLEGVLKLSGTYFKVISGMSRVVKSRILPNYHQYDFWCSLWEQSTVVVFKVRESSNFEQGVANPPRNLTKIFLNLW